MVRDPEPLAELRALYAAKATAEEDAADALLPSLPVRRSGDPLARVLLLKGEPGPADLSAGEALAGADGDAARAALDALSLPVGSVLAVVTRPSAEVTPDLAVGRLAIYLEACDPEVAVALDGIAAEDLAAAVGMRALPFGEPGRVRGRVVLAVDGLEASLEDEARKRRVWSQLKVLTAGP